ncbi:divalent-cation tolerance protein CutA [Methanolobus mangrovi]|uniref:Divalent-cation tolerance protein CutA n=1 Tax=Methanolobus mangrovi TaxID=3072977 RepID=A0AA51UG43_9EURY|nr:divalent-cation tolerance protein CutA [Methanolobus mangrovi]WMW22558.1 divalent-cation tolerance protein CutA [Methanolobus mangrovi]
MFSIVYTTTKDEEEAKRIAHKLVEQKLAACVNMHPIDSIYMWEGKIEEDREIALSIKTTTCRVEAITECIKRMHSYDLPAIISWEIDGEEEYLKWISDSTTA